jgi:hypothetical protein
MRVKLRISAIGIAGCLLAGQVVLAQETPPTAPSKSLPSVGATSVSPSDPDVLRSSQEPAEPSASAATSPLDELAWMVGDWIDEDEDATIESSVAWTKNGTFLRRMFRVIPKEGPTHEGMQIIGWDPAEQTIRSWTYDADGGFGEERWRRTGDRWSIRAKYTLPDGARGSATNLIRPVDANRYTWRSVNRVLGGALVPDIDEVMVVRRGEAPLAGAGAVEAPARADSPPVAPQAPAGEPASPAAPVEEKKP